MAECPRSVDEAELPRWRGGISRVRCRLAAAVPRQARVAQEGQMLLKPGGRALPFTAVEDFSVEEVAFLWRARFRFCW
jgi:hypothetical protein